MQASDLLNDKLVKKMAAISQMIFSDTFSFKKKGQYFN